MSYTLSEAALATGKSKTTIHRAIKSGKISSTKLDNGTYSIEPSELHRVFPKHYETRNVERSARGEVEHSKSYVETLQSKLESIEKERERERAQLQEVISDLRNDRDKWRQQANGLLEDKRPRGLWERLIRK